MSKKRVLKFPSGFLWGSATAAHQVEGGNSNNNWWEFEQVKGNIDNGEKSAEAVDHYNRYEEDFDIAKSLGHNIHRFSIEWSRIEPREGEFDRSELEHYRRVINVLKKRNIQVMLTLFHFTLPKWFAKKGAFEKRGNIKFFKRFVDYVVKNLGENVDYWVTINEANIYSGNGYYTGHFPPGRKGNLLLYFRVLSVLADAHKEAYFTIHKYSKDAQVGYSHNFVYFEPFRENSILDRMIFSISKFIFIGFFIKKIKSHLDFLGVQYYCRNRVKFKIGGAFLGIAEEYGVENHISDDVPMSDIGWEIYPKGIYQVLMELSRLHVPIVITENGIADRKDKFRKDFIKKVLINVHRAIKEGIDIRGYIHWSLMDNVEWHMGRDPRFGLVEIIYEENLKRVIRPSAKYFAKICKENKLVLEEEG